MPSELVAGVVLSTTNLFGIGVTHDQAEQQWGEVGALVFAAQYIHWTGSVLVNRCGDMVAGLPVLDRILTIVVLNQSIDLSAKLCR